LSDEKDPNGITARVRGFCHRGDPSNTCLVLGNALHAKRCMGNRIQSFPCYRPAAFGAEAIRAIVDADQCRLDRLEFYKPSLSKRLQDFFILPLDGTIVIIVGPWDVQIPLYSSQAVQEFISPPNQSTLVIWHMHLKLPSKRVAGIARRRTPTG
jgi:hypothetical protein